MSSTGSLIIISCDEPDPRLDPSRYFNLSSPTTKVFKTPGGRIVNAINSIYHADQASKIGMIVVVQHTGCSSTMGTAEDNIRFDMKELKESGYVRSEVKIVGYVLEVETGRLREVSVPRTVPDTEARRKVLSEMQDFGPFWS